MGKIKDFVTNSSHTKTRSLKRFVTAVVIFSIIGLLVNIYVFAQAWDVQIKFYAKWIECGRVPLQEPIAWGPQYISYYEQAPKFSIFRNHTEYFCTEKEAELSGLSSNPNSYDFPHLTQEERRKLLNHETQ